MARKPSISTRTIPLSPFEETQKLSATVVRGPDVGLSVTADDATISIGTAPDNTLVLTDDTVSAYHADLRARRDGITIVDHGSTNGTRLGKARLVRAFVEPGVHLMCGNSVVEITSDASGVIPLHNRDGLHALRGRSSAMREAMALIRKVGPTETCVLIVGETGTGKELGAHALHAESQRAEAPFVTVDCGALAKDLVASELFGHERGAFTGAERVRKGAFERANGGTVFLDEIGELPTELQTQLLGVLSRRRFSRVGGNEEIPVDVRVVAATHRDLRADVNAGRFRADLYFRLAVVRVSLPPLRERVQDIPLLISHFLEECGHVGPSPFSTEAEARLMQHPWPGNVRELRNVVEATLATGFNPDLAPPKSGDMPLIAAEIALPYKEARSKLVHAFEEHYLTTLLRRANGNVSQAARLACMTRSHLFDLLRKHNLR